MSDPTETPTPAVETPAGGEPVVATETPATDPAEVAVEPEQGALPLEADAAEGEPADGDSPEKNPTRVEAGKKAQATRAKRIAVRAELSKNEDVRKLVAEAEARGAKTATAKAEEAAARASMTEVDRLTAELADMKNANATAQAERDQVTLERDYAQAETASEQRIQPKARPQVRSLVQQAMDSDASLNVVEALDFVLAEHSYMLQAPEPAAPSRPSTAPVAAKRATQAPAPASAAKPKRVGDMTKEQYAVYKAETHNMH
jgi:hypothetical protein